jgi:hypothetical protein
MIRGLFGGGNRKREMEPSQVPMYQGVPQEPMGGEIGYTPQAQRIMQGQAPMPQQQGYWQGGNRFTGRDAAAGALAAIGDGLHNWAGGRGGAIDNLMQSRAMPAQLAAQQQLMAAKEAAELRQYGAKKEIDAQFAGGPKIGSFEWFQTAAPEQVQQYMQYMDITSPAMATTWQGPTILPRSQLGGMGVPSRPVGGLTPVTGGTSGNAGGNFR